MVFVGPEWREVDFDTKKKTPENPKNKKQKTKKQTTKQKNVSKVCGQFFEEWHIGRLKEAFCVLLMCVNSPQHGPVDLTLTSRDYLLN